MKLSKAQREQIRQAMRLLRAIPSERRAQASRDNGRRPVRPGSRPRGWPKGRPRKEKT